MIKNKQSMRIINRAIQKSGRYVHDREREGCFQAAFFMLLFSRSRFLPIHEHASLPVTGEEAVFGRQRPFRRRRRQISGHGFVLVGRPREAPAEAAPAGVPVDGIAGARPIGRRSVGARAGLPLLPAHAEHEGRLGGEGGQGVLAARVVQGPPDGVGLRERAEAEVRPAVARRRQERLY